RIAEVEEPRRATVRVYRVPEDEVPQHLHAPVHLHAVAKRKEVRARRHVRERSLVLIEITIDRPRRPANRRRVQHARGEWYEQRQPRLLLQPALPRAEK